MTPGAKPRARLDWSDEALEMVVEVDPRGAAHLTRLAAASGGSPESATDDRVGLPLVDLVLAGEGRSWSGRRYCESVAGARLRHVDHDESVSGPWRRVRVRLADPVTSLRVTVCYDLLSGQGALRAWVLLTNEGTEPVTVESVTSFLCGGLCGADGAVPDDLAALDVEWAENDWLAEGRWCRRALRDALPDLNRAAHPGADPRGTFGLTSVGTWSSGTYLPMGAVVNRDTGHAWVWQVEHNGAWHWQVGEYACRRAAGGEGGGPAPVPSGAYVALLGPTDTEHHWRLTLAPGESFTTVPVGVAVGRRGFDDALAGLTACRRATRRPHEDHRRLPVIFNDYMNTLMGDPTTQRLLPLVSAAAAAGAEYFCVDSGWYAELDEGWWDTVGAWRPSRTRFPNGITEVLDHIRAAGMVPGLWLEPEVVGVRSPVVAELPADAFLSRGGRRVVEHGRYHLDLRHPKVIERLDETVDYLVEGLGVGYLKLDYNINGGPGTDLGGLAAGAGLLAANRAHLDWLDAVLDRHPGLVIENCGSGGMRMDYAMLSRLQLQSTSDQQDFVRYAAIAAAAPAAVTPEQGAVWAYPQPEFADNEIVFTLCNALLGRVHLSGHLDRMNAAQRRLVSEAVEVYKRIRRDLAQAVPFWPLGRPAWSQPWTALGMRAPGVIYVVVWRRDGLPAAASRKAQEIDLMVPALRGRDAAADILYPRAADDVSGGRSAASWHAARGQLTVRLPVSPSACLVRLA